MEKNHTKAELLAHLKDEELINAIRSSEALSDVMEALWEQPEAYYNQLGDRLPQILSKTVTPDLLENYGILINPAEIPNSTLKEYIALYDKPTTTVQTRDKIVNYFGNVKLDINEGTGRLYNSRFPATAHGRVFLEAYGNTHVMASEDSCVNLHDYAICDSTEYAFVSANDHSHVNSRSNDSLMLAGYATGNILSGNTNATLYDNCQLLVTKDAAVENYVHATVNDGALLYTDHKANDIDVEINSNYYGSILFIQDYNLTAEELVPLLYIQNPQLQHLANAEQLAKVQDHIADRLPRWVLANALPHTENVSSRAQTSRMSR